MPVLSLVIAFAAAAIAGADDDLIREASTTEFGSGAYGCADTIAVAASVGIDYKTLVDGCLQTKDATTRQRCVWLMLWLSAFGGLDAASGQGHAAVLGSLVRKIGDDSFVQLVADQPHAMCEAAGLDVIYNFGLGEISDVEVAKLEQAFPKTFKTLGVTELLKQTKAEQADADQPATAEDSKTKGDEKPKPEPKRRSQ